MLLVEASVFSGSLSSLWPTFVGFFCACLDFFGPPCPLFPFFSLPFLGAFFLSTKSIKVSSKVVVFLHLLNPTHDPPNLQVWFYITDCLWTILYIYIYIYVIIPLASFGLFVNPRSEEEEEEEEEEALKSRE
jgi:hypothetical protein